MRKFVLLFLFIFLTINIANAMGEKPKMSDKLYAVFETNRGNITCVLYPKDAPKTVENFVGLANGTKEWTDPRSGEKTNEPLYNSTIVHRVIPDFMIQGGDPMGTGMGGPGYQFEDEIVADLQFNQIGRLAMANSGPGTNGSQFFITTALTNWLNGKHTIFGQVVEGQEVVNAISILDRDQMDRPIDPVVINKIVIKDKL